MLFITINLCNLDISELNQKKHIAKDVHRIKIICKIIHQQFNKTNHVYRIKVLHHNINNFHSLEV